MKYFFVSDTNSNRHIIVAKNLERAIEIWNNDDPTLKIEDIYELEPNTFDEEGFLISD